MEETLSLFEDIFSSTGLLAKSLPSFEEREGQREMVHKIWEAFEEEKSAIFEAGTGIGKSLAYLIPALLWSYQTGEKIVVSTYTISLQEQLLEKDIPFLLKALGLDLHVVLAKGMNNYICMRKLEEVSHQGRLFDDSLDAVVSWSKTTKDGTKSSIKSFISHDVWSRIFAESENCSYVKCPHYKQCFFFKARQKVQEADVIIVNHHLLMAHLQSPAGILPPFTRLIVDEAHHLETVARSSLTKTLDRVQLFRFLSKVHSDAHPEVSRLFAISDAFKERKDEALDIRFRNDLPGQKKELVTKIQSAFDLLDEFFLNHRHDPKWRLTKNVLLANEWQQKIAPAFLELFDEMKRFQASLDSIEGDIPEELKEKMQNALLDIASTSEALKETIATLQAFFSEDETPVRWAERRREGTTLYMATLDIAPFLKEKLFETVKSSILCSATLCVDKNFEHFISKIGLNLEETIQKIYPSPFDFKTRTKLIGFSDLPAPNSYQFIDEACDVIDSAVDASKGGAFVLFTSYDMLNKCAEKLAHLPLFVQGDLPRHQLLEEYKQQKNGVLLGTDSFWEGVDVAGDALKLVIIVKLPFPVPSEPLIEARAEKLKSEGKDPFMGDSVPLAAIKFKQGFGRLMRRKADRGCVLCLDQRLFTRTYGKVFLKSLPECITSYGPRAKIINEMRDFYRNP